MSVKLKNQTIKNQFSKAKRKRGKLNLEKAMNKKFFHDPNIEKLDPKRALDEIERKLEARMKWFNRRDSKKSVGSSIKSGEKMNPTKCDQDDLMIADDANNCSLLTNKNKISSHPMTKMAQKFKKYAPTYKFKRPLSETTDLINKNLKDSTPIKQDINTENNSTENKIDLTYVYTNSKEFTKTKEFSDIIVPMSNVNRNESESFVERFAEI